MASVGGHDIDSEVDIVLLNGENSLCDRFTFGVDSSAGSAAAAHPYSLGRGAANMYLSILVPQFLDFRTGRGIETAILQSFGDGAVF